ncbi:MAG: bifunctional glutamate N-acetyltransferase/amino-acid acetyltransferase ArgJ [Rhizobiaceae bacterium]|nr:bifunctional glutamate N-acetyltransferase/amino-acid acetyltransferase ArgJ [Rhizobiaceae bacterium]
MKVSPLAPKLYPELPPLKGVALAAIEAGIKYVGRKDLCLIRFDKPAEIAGVFTTSKCPSAPVDWCRKHLSKGKANAILVNSGNANAFTGKKGADAVILSAKAVGAVLGCSPKTVFLASTGVIGEPLDASGFEEKVRMTEAVLSEDKWHEAAQAIMTTDTYPKLATRSFEIEGKTYSLNGIAKGSGMIAPDMATMLAFLVTDLPVDNKVLQKLLSRNTKNTFNAVTVDSDTSTSDTVLLASCGEGKKITEAGDARLKVFKSALEEVMHELSMLLVRDGEGATKQVGITVTGAKNKRSARRIALAIANSPLVKTAIAGEDANWGRIVMAVGKAGEPADRDKLEIRFGDVVVAREGERVPDYNEEDASKIMKNDEIEIYVDLGLGNGSAKVWTCDLTKEYVAINGDYRS